MDMGMILELPPPGVKHPKEAGQITADKLFVLSVSADAANNAE